VGLSRDSAHVDQGYAVYENSLTGEETSSEEKDDDMAVDEEERDDTEVSENVVHRLFMLRSGIHSFCIAFACPS
jgi:hypothetical protein